MNLLQAFSVVYSHKPVYLVAQCFQGTKQTYQEIIVFHEKFRTYGDFVQSVNQAKASFRDAHSDSRVDKLLGAFFSEPTKTKIVFRFRENLPKAVGIINNAVKTEYIRNVA